MTQFSNEGLADSELNDRFFEDSENDWSDLPDKLTIDLGLATLEIKEVSQTWSKAKPEEGKVAKAMIVVKTQVSEPTSSSGMLHTMYFVLGSEDDPEARLPETRKRRMGAIDFKNLIAACKLPVKNYKNSELFATLVGCQFVTEFKASKTSDRVDNKGYFPLGAAPTGVRTGAVRPQAPRASAPPPIATQAKVACPVCETQVNRSEYGEHLRSHSAESETVS